MSLMENLLSIFYIEEQLSFEDAKKSESRSVVFPVNIDEVLKLTVREQMLHIELDKTFCWCTYIF